MSSSSLQVDMDEVPLLLELVAQVHIVAGLLEFIYSALRNSESLPWYLSPSQYACSQTVSTGAALMTTHMNGILNAIPPFEAFRYTGIRELNEVLVFWKHLRTKCFCVRSIFFDALQRILDPSMAKTIRQNDFATAMERKAPMYVEKLIEEIEELQELLFGLVRHLER